MIIEGFCKGPKVTKDGVTVAKSVEFEDSAKNVGANLVKQVVDATNKAAGDAGGGGVDTRGDEEVCVEKKEDCRTKTSNGTSI